MAQFEKIRRKEITYIFLKNGKLHIDYRTFFRAKDAIEEVFKCCDDMVVFADFVVKIVRLWNKKSKEFTEEEWRKINKKELKRITYLQFIENASEELWIEAIKENYYSMMYIEKKEQTEKMILEIVKHKDKIIKNDFDIIKYINDDYKEFCLEKLLKND